MFIGLLVSLWVIYRKAQDKPIIPFQKGKVNNIFKSRSTTSRNLNIDQKYNSIKIKKEKRLDRILDKISSKGMKSLSKKEKKFLASYKKEKNE